MAVVTLKKMPFGSLFSKNELHNQASANFNIYQSALNKEHRTLALGFF